MIRGGVSMVLGPESRSYPTLWTGPSTQIVGSMMAELNLVIVGAAMVVTSLLTLDEERIKEYAQLHWLLFTDYTSLLGQPAIASLIAAQVKGANGRLPENQRIGTSCVIPRAMHSGDEELTPTQRLNREETASQYANLFCEPNGVRS